MKRLTHLDYKWLVGIVYIMALFMDLLDMTVTNVAVPTLAKRFTASTTTIGVRPDIAIRRNTDTYVSTVARPNHPEPKK